MAGKMGKSALVALTLLIVVAAVGVFASAFLEDWGLPRHVSDGRGYGRHAARTRRTGRPRFRFYPRRTPDR